MENPGFTHLVLVDFENVQAIDLGLIEGKAVHVTLLIGKSQQKLDLNLVRQIHRQHTQVAMVEVGGSGRNALDLTLAFYLGEAVARAPAVEFCIVSKDKDFDPMIAHLKTRSVNVGRFDAFTALPFLPVVPAPPKKTPRIKKPLASSAEKNTPADEKLQKLITRLKNNLGPRPKRKDSLLHHIGNAFGNKLSPEEQSDLLQQLIAGGVVQIDAMDKVTY